MGGEAEKIHVPAPPGLLQKIAGPLVVATLFALAGAGIATRDRAIGNTVANEQLIRDLGRLENKLAIIEKDLQVHEEKPAHREAEQRLKWLEKR